MGLFTNYVWTVKDKLHYRRHQNLTIGRYILWWKCNCTYVLNMVQVSSYVKIITNLFFGFLERKMFTCWLAIYKYSQNNCWKNLKTRAVFSNKNLKSHKMVGWFYNCVCVCSIFFQKHCFIIKGSCHQGVGGNAVIILQKENIFSQ